MESGKRIIAFDVLRVIMLFLLIVFHAGVSFTVTDIDGWYYQDKSKNILFDGVLSFIHAFRHPLFFLISGYVTELMYTRYSQSAVFKKRLTRIGIPLLIVVFSLAPVVTGTFPILNGESTTLTLKNMFPELSTGYVWFLYYLLIFSAFHLLLKRFELIRFISTIHFSIRQSIVLVFMIAGLITFKVESLYGDYHLLPNFASIFGYVLFYILGATMSYNSNDLHQIKSRAYYYLIVGFTGLGVFLWLKYLALNLNSHSYFYECIVSFSIAMFGLTFGGLGLAMRLYKRQNTIIQYFSKASYFLYLIHLPILMYFLYLIAPMTFNPFVKFLLIISPTLLISVLLHWVWNKAWKGDPPI